MCKTVYFLASWINRSGARRCHLPSQYFVWSSVSRHFRCLFASTSAAADNYEHPRLALMTRALR